MFPAAASLLLICAVLLAPGWPALEPGRPAALASLLVLVLPALVAWRLAGLRWTVPVLLAAWCLVNVLLAMGQRLPESRWGEDLLVTGRVCDFPRVADGVARFVLETDQAAGARAVPRRIQVSWYDVIEPPAIGERWQLHLRVRSPRGLANPGGFDYERWLMARRLPATAWVRADSRNGRVAGTGKGCGVVARWRGKVAAGVTAVAGESAALPYLLGLSVGAYQALPAADWEMLRRTGTVHLIAISGFHVALVAVPLGLLGALGGRGLLALGVRVVPRVLGAVVALFAAVGYGALAGFSVPTLRAVLMLAAITLLLILRRPLLPATVLSLALILVLLAEPFAPLNPGFWLSFAGVFILIAGIRVWQAGASQAAGLPARGLRAAGNLVLTQLAMMAGLAPLLVVFFAQIPLTGALANLLAIPLFSLFIVPLTVAGALLTLLSPAFAAPVLAVATLGLGLWRQWIEWCADLPAALWELAPAGSGRLLLAICGATWLLWPRPIPGRWLGLLLLAALAGGGIAPPPPGGVRVTVLDVGQGLSVVIQTHSHSMIYDAGPAYRGDDAGGRVVVPALRALGVRQPDLLLISHSDMDHRGGSTGILRHFPVVQTIGPVDRVGRVPPVPCRAGMDWVWDDVHFRILHPELSDSAPPRRVANNDSCVLLVRAGAASLLLPGDIERATEARLVAAGHLSPVDLMVAPHHGSRTSSSEPFTSATRPRYVVFTTGFRNRWRFPADDVVARWQAVGACALDTAAEGALGFEAGPGQPLALTMAYRRNTRRFWRPRPRSGPSLPCVGDLSEAAATGV